MKITIPKPYSLTLLNYIPQQDKIVCSVRIDHKRTIKIRGIYRIQEFVENDKNTLVELQGLILP